MTCALHPERSADIAACARCGRFLCSDCRVELDERTYCAACKAQQVRDVLAGADTTRLPLASVEHRFSALFLDALLFSPLGLAWIVYAMMTAFDPGFPDLVAINVVTGLAFAAYEAILLRRAGATVGKRATELRVVSAAGEPLSTGQAWVRSVTRTFLGFVLIDYLPALVTRERTCLHDLLARTRVVRITR